METRWVIFGRAGASGVAAGALVGVAAVMLAGTAVAHRLAVDASEPLLEVTHLPVLLTAGGEPVELRYDVYCSGEGDSEAADCEATGTVYVRSGGTSGEFDAIALQEDAGASEGRFVAQVPDTIARSRAGFSYYAVLRSSSSGRAVTLPAGGAAAPHESRPLVRAAAVVLGSHVFDRTRSADERVAEAAWGEGDGDVALEEGHNLAPIGGSAFDVDESGTVHVLDEANRRVLRWSPGRRGPQHVPLAIRGTLADLSVAEDGAMYVLETTADTGRSPLMRIFAADGAARGVVEIAERAAAVRMGPNGPVALQQPSGQWMRAASSGRPLPGGDQARSGRSGRPLADGGEVIVLRVGNEVRVALVGRNGARRSWRVTSDTALAEVQLAEPLGDRLLLVVRAYTDAESEFVALLLDRDGLAQRFSLSSADWAETAPLSRFRLAGSSLYRLGSTPQGIFVDRFDLEVR
jgi:hypothetical protein